MVVTSDSFYVYVCLNGYQILQNIRSILIAMEESYR